MAVIENLEINLSANTEGFANDLKEAEKLAASSGVKIDNNLKTNTKANNSKLKADLTDAEKLSDKSGNKINDNLETTPKADIKPFETDLVKAQKVARDTGKKLDAELLTKLEVDTSELKVAKSESAKILREIKKQYADGLIDKNAVIQAQRSFDRLSSSTTEANRKLQNYKNTGDETTSRLQAKFNSLTDEMKISRKELEKLGVSTKKLDKFDDQVKKITSEFEKGKISIKDYQNQLNKLQKDVQKTGGAFANMGKSVSNAVKGFIALYAVDKVKDAFLSASKAAIEFESAFTGVAKTIDATPEQLSKINQGIINLSKEIPISVTELSSLAEAGGQLGVATEDILFFTETVAKIGVATNLTSEEAATAFARIAEVTGTPITDIDKMASSVVGLGNNFATTEKEILNFSSRIAGTSSVVGITTDEIFGISTAFSAVGIQAEAGGSTVNKALLSINDAVLNGGKNLDEFARVSGKTTDEFREGWKNEAGKTFADFIEGLGEEGANGANILSELVGNSSEVKRAFLAVAGAGDLMNRTIEKSNTEFVLNNALNEEAAKRFETTASQIQINNNKWKAFGASVGGVMNKVLIPLYSGFTDFFTKTLPNVIDFGTSVFKDFLNGLSSVLANGIILFSNFGQNVGIAFGNIPEYAKKGLNAFLGVLGDTINKGIGILNKLPKVNISEIDIKLNDAGAVAKYKSMTDGMISLDNMFNANNVKGHFERVQAQGVADKKRVQDVKDRIKEEIKLETGLTKTISSMSKGVAELKDKLNNAEVGSDEFIKLQKEISLAEKELESFTKTASSGSGASKKSKEVAKAEKEIQKEYKNTLKEIENTYNTGNKVIDKTISNTEKSIEKIDKSLETLREGIADVNNELENLESDKGETLGTRKLELLEDEKDLRNEINEIGFGEISNDDLIKRNELQGQLDKLTLESKTIADAINEDNKRISEEKALLTEKQIELQKQLKKETGTDEIVKLKEAELEIKNKLLDLDKNSLQSKIDEEKRLSELNPTERYLEEFKVKKNALLEEKKLKEQQIVELEKQKEDEKALLTKFNNQKIFLLEKYKEQSWYAELAITENLQLEVDKRQKILDSLKGSSVTIEQTTTSNNAPAQKTEPAGHPTTSEVEQPEFDDSYNKASLESLITLKEEQKVLLEDYHNFITELDDRHLENDVEYKVNLKTNFSELKDFKDEMNIEYSEKVSELEVQITQLKLENLNQRLANIISNDEMKISQEETFATSKLAIVTAREIQETKVVTEQTEKRIAMLNKIEQKAYAVARALKKSGVRISTELVFQDVVTGTAGGGETVNNISNNFTIDGSESASKIAKEVERVIVKSYKSAQKGEF